MTVFLKVEALGNDFVIVENEPLAAWPKDRVQATCDRHRGIGADGILLVNHASDADARMTVINADGSRPEMCGNGLRCVARVMGQRLGQRDVRIQTEAGIKACRVESDLVTADLGIVSMLGKVDLGSEDYGAHWYKADAGNPHLVSFDLEPQAAARIGAALAVHPLFPEGTNVECARIVDGVIELVVWERGAGLTLACGTGAGATAVCAWELGLLPDRPVVVRLPGGELTVWREEGRVRQRGPARVVFAGEI